MGTSGGLLGADVMQALLSSPQFFDFAQAMELLEACDEDGLRFGKGLERKIRLHPDDNLVFPASDIRGCRQDGHSLTLLMGFFGLYGIDAPVPHYLLDRTTAADDDADRMRDFLNIFNPRFYALLYRAMQVSRPAAGRLPPAFHGCAAALSGMAPGKAKHPAMESAATPDRRYFPVGRIRSAGGLQSLLQDQVPDIRVEVRDRRPVWQPLGHGCSLGQGECGLGDNTILGGRAYVANGNVAVRLGPVDSSQARELLPGHTLGDRLKNRVQDYLQGQVQAELQIRVRPSRRASVELGVGEQRLGWSAWLGERLQDEYTIRVAPDATHHDKEYVQGGHHAR
ncbi:MAG: type VI secretion system baseplate subunit TssG [Pseudomonadales bacterium]|nr:type VI secretion system baseplate subunit TssG [Pseudomonadales bacterium]